jgi:biopolymer transport protein ExbD
MRSRPFSCTAAAILTILSLSCSRLNPPMATMSFTPSSNGKAAPGPADGRSAFRFPWEDDETLTIHLPASGEAKAQQPGPSGPSKPSQVTISVRAVKEGANAGGIQSIIVRSPGAEKTVSNVDSLEQYLNSIRKGLTNQNSADIVAESKLRYAHLIEVMDACIRTGFNEVGILPPPDLEK